MGIYLYDAAGGCVKVTGSLGRILMPRGHSGTISASELAQAVKDELTTLHSTATWQQAAHDGTFATLDRAALNGGIAIGDSAPETAWWEDRKLELALELARANTPDATLTWS